MPSRLSASRPVMSANALLLASGTLLGLSFSGWSVSVGATPAAATTTASCAQFAVLPVVGGLYSVQTNEWNSDAEQCVTTWARPSSTPTPGTLP